MTRHAQDVTVSEMLEAFRKKGAEKSNATTAKSYRLAISAFERFLADRSYDDEIVTLDVEIIREWCTWMFYKGYSRKTVGYQLKIVRPLCAEVTGDEQSAVVAGIRELQAEIERLPDMNSVLACPDVPLLPAFRELVQNSVLASDRGVALRRGTTLPQDVTLFAVLSGGMPISTLAKLRKIDPPAWSCQLLESIRNKYARPKNAYLFPFDQSVRTPRQLSTAVAGLLHIGLSAAGIKPQDITENAPAMLWSRLAYEAGLSPAVICGCLGEMAEKVPMLAVAKGTAVDNDGREMALARVYNVLADHSTHWYAFRMRAGVSRDAFMSRLASGGDNFVVSETFYPLEEVARRYGDDLVVMCRPVVRGLMFIRCRSVDVPGILRYAGDLVWCYADRTESGCRYSVIPDSQMKLYRETLAEIVGVPGGRVERPLEAGDRVQIMEGSFSGRVGIVAETRRQGDGGATVYRVILPGGADLDWSVDIGADMLSVITEAGFDKRLADLANLQF